MKKKIVALGVLGALLFSSAVYAADPWTGTGGRGVNLAVLIPEGRGLSADQAYIPMMVQGVFVADLSKYSAMSVIDTANIEKVLKETESGVYKEADFVKLGEINADHFLIGSLTKTSSGFSLQIQIIGKDLKIKASYSGACTIDEFDNYIAIKKASLVLLEGMGISLTPQARAELQQAAALQTRQAQTNLAQGRVAEQQGRETAAMSFFSQAATIDPSLLEAASRLNVLSRNVSSGSIGADARNDVQWRKDWIARLTEAEQYFDRFFKTYNQPYALIQLTGLEHGKTDYQTESMPISFKVDFRESDAGRWTGAVTAAANPVLNGFNQTGKKSEWGLNNWPRSRVSNLAPFDGGSKRFSIIAELLNDKNKVIGTQTFTTSGSWSFSFNSGISMRTSTSGVQTVTFPRVNVYDVTDLMTIRFASVDGKAADAVAKSGMLQITTQADYRDAAGFNYDGGGYSWDGYDKEGYDKDGYDRNGFDRNRFNREGWNTAGYGRDGYDRNGFDRRGFNKEGYTVGGSRYNEAGFDEAGFDKAGYDRNGFDRRGFNKKGFMADGSLYNEAGFDEAGFDKEGYTVDGSLYNEAGFDKAGYDKTGYDRAGFDKAGYDKTGYDRAGYDRNGYDRNGFDRRGFNKEGYNKVDGSRYDRDGYNRLGFRRWSPLSSNFEVLYTFHPELPIGFTAGLFGAYGSFSFDKVESSHPPGEVVGGYTFNLLSTRHVGLGLPLGVGYNRLEEQLVLETGLQLRFGGIYAAFELRGTYRTIGFKDDSFTISTGVCFYPALYHR